MSRKRREVVAYDEDDGGDIPQHQRPDDFLFNGIEYGAYHGQRNVIPIAVEKFPDTVQNDERFFKRLFSHNLPLSNIILAAERFFPQEFSFE